MSLSAPKGENDIDKGAATMTAEELEERFAIHEANIRALVASFVEPTAKATEVMAAAEERARAEKELYDKRAAEHDAQARAQHERAAQALDLQRRNVEAWERIASALERLSPWSLSSSFTQPLSAAGGVCMHGTTEIRTDGRYCSVCGQRLVG